MSASVTVIWLPVTFLPALSPLVDATASLICTHTHTYQIPNNQLALPLPDDRSFSRKQRDSDHVSRSIPSFFFFLSLPPFFLPSFQALLSIDNERQERSSREGKTRWKIVAIIFSSRNLWNTRYPRPRMIAATVHSARLLCIPHIISNFSVTISLSVRSRILRITLLPDWNAISIEHADGIGTNCSNILSRCWPSNWTNSDRIVLSSLATYASTFLSRLLRKTRRYLSAWWKACTQSSFELQRAFPYNCQLFPHNCSFYSLPSGNISITSYLFFLLFFLPYQILILFSFFLFSFSYRWNLSFSEFLVAITSLSYTISKPRSRKKKKKKETQFFN